MKPDLKAIFKQIEKVQEELEKVQAELENKTVTEEVGGGMVKVTVNGKKEVVKIEIDKEVVNPDDIEMLEDLLVAAVNKALQSADKMISEEIAKATSGLIPGLPGFLFNFPGFKA
ncbi:MAG: YbaB/EbfC family nucleoid-associated protein [Candidatus Kryptonium sp.]|nr:YbaB/EbfC family nucleoid-associated protein [Candidatus Kryptonium sp.]MCX7762440.1 YbaB/EbfC family nucleoid-associated protein [Candidatus Kryptonium sp.]MDW8109933.1 YbaB/EbfC family nucleoid-associated protein [Candidatus Kryptonium sp.]